VWQDFGYSYTYDTKSYLLSIQDTATPARTWWQADASAGYDYLDRPALVKKGSNWTQRTYRPTDGVLTAIKTGPTAGSTAIQNLSFDYDGLGNLRSRTGSGGTETPTYDNLNRLKTTKQGTIDYADNGNITNKPNISGTRSTADFTYDATHPHAVASAFGYALGYDANGNLTSRTKTGESWNFRYAGFDKPRWMAKTVGSTTVGSEFLYNANRSRTVQLEFTGLTGGVPSGYVRKRVYGLGSTLEANYEKAASAPDAAWALKKVRVYVPGPNGVIGSREFDPAAPIGSQEKAFIYHYDHLGSIESITPFVPAGSGLAADSTGKPGRFSEDAWGQRRNPLTWSGAPTATDDGGADSLTPRGFTGHEMLDDLGLVNAKGRIYDPLLGRFLSADIVVQDASNLQAYNRYSYVKNNPLTLTDPSGFAWWDPSSWDWKHKRSGGSFFSPTEQKSDVFKGKENYRQFYTYVEKSPGGQARIVTIAERRPTTPQIVDQNSPKAEQVDTVTLQDSPGQAMLTKTMGANLGILGMTPSRSSPLLTSNDMKKAAAEVKQKATEVSQKMTRDSDGETRMVGVKSPSKDQVRGQVTTTNATMQANGKAMSGLIGLASAATQGAKQAAEMTEVRINLVYGGGGLFGLLPSRPTGEIVVQQVSDMNRVQSFAEHQDLPAINIMDRTVTVDEPK
jgi:RHS repeat-associated protein